MKSLPQLIVATRNAQKTAEIRAMIGDRFEVLDVTSFPEAPQIEETGTTFWKTLPQGGGHQPGAGRLDIVR